MNTMIADIYGPIHKAIRLALSDFLIQAGSCDAADRAAWKRIEASWSRIASLLDAHSFHEDIHIRPMIYIVAPDIARALDGQHEALDRSMRRIGEAVAGMRSLDAEGERRNAARGIYLSFSTFLADYFDHMSEEETRASPALVDHFAPPTLFAAQRALVGSLPQDMRLIDVPVIARSLAPHEHLDLEFEALDGAAPSFFADAIRIMGDVLDRGTSASLDEAITRRAA